ncbi:MAG: hypothetical protein JW714_00285, partial [Candidatus Omnitrophica bacterium]|nr:hypothetical protein [Candidatus Omnitrophota bacterium]
NQGRRACPPPQNQGRRACPPPQNQGRRDCPGSGKIIVGRNEAENKRLMGLAGRKDTFLKLRDFTGPITVARNNGAQANLLTIAARLTARYSNAKDQDQVWVDYWSKDAQEKKSILVQPADEQLVGQMRI